MSAPSSLVTVVLTACLVASAIVVAAVIVKRCLILVMPNELVVLLGRRYRTPDGRVLGYRVVFGGRVFRLPFVERAIRMPRGPFAVRLETGQVFTRDGARLRIEGRVEVGIGRSPFTVDRAIERFLERPPEEIAEVARQILESNLRKVAGQLESEQIVGSLDRFQDKCLNEALGELEAHGLELGGFRLEVTLSHPAEARDEPAPAGQRLLARLADRDLSAEAKQAAVLATGGQPLTLVVGVERAGPSSQGELPEAYRQGRSAYGLVEGLEVEVVYPAERAAEAELVQGMQVPVMVRAQRWDGPRQCLVVLAV